MFTREKLQEWRGAKTRAISDPNTDPSVIVSMQEMYIEAKLLRRDNLMLLQREELFDLLVELSSKLVSDYYVGDELDDLIEQVRDNADELGIDWET